MCVEMTFKDEINYYRWYPINFHVNTKKYLINQQFLPTETSFRPLARRTNKPRMQILFLKCHWKPHKGIIED